MTIQTRVLDHTLCSAKHTVSLTNKEARYMPKCHSAILASAKEALKKAKELFSDNTNLSKATIYNKGILGQTVNVTTKTVCSQIPTGSQCFELNGYRIKPHADSAWADYITILNWNSTSTNGSRLAEGSDFWYHAVSNQNGATCERLNIGGLPEIYYGDCKAPSVNGTITDLPMLSTICQETAPIRRTIVKWTPKPLPSVPSIASFALPVLTGIGGCWALSQAFKAAKKTHAIGYALLGVAALGISAASLF